ncbi:hypothetical protein [Mesorhizobium sp. CA12]|uniref:hypothetical protein n=1 Tax=Mesorhizobium sp. CA12 TaxID=2876644 RepID=UPI001CCC5E58|nr:hypothetical protein [Mesorhizobium sp. CA12]MBZ9862740.1 hypothetical protein [Mesorhizobium sp. CA12]
MERILLGEVVAEEPTPFLCQDTALVKRRRRGFPWPSLAIAVRREIWSSVSASSGGLGTSKSALTSRLFCALQAVAVSALCLGDLFGPPLVDFWHDSVGAGYLFNDLQQFSQDGLAVAQALRSAAAIRLFVSGERGPNGTTLGRVLPGFF